MGYGWQYQGMGGTAWLLMIIVMFVLWGVLAIGLVALLRHYRTRPPGVATADPSQTAITILKERFARGEVSEEEYGRRLTILKDQT